MSRTADFEVIDQGSFIGFRPVSDEGKRWMDENVESEGWQWMGSVLYVDHRYADDLISGIDMGGLTYEVS